MKRGSLNYHVNDINVPMHAYILCLVLFAHWCYVDYQSITSNWLFDHRYNEPFFDINLTLFRMFIDCFFTCWFFVRLHLWLTVKKANTQVFQISEIRKFTLLICITVPPSCIRHTTKLSKYFISDIYVS